MHFSVPPVAPPPHVPKTHIVDFDIYNLPPAMDVHSAWKTLQAPGVPDIVWTPRNEGHWILTRGTLIKQAYNDWEHFATRIMLVPKSVGEQYHFIPNTVDPPVHHPYRMLLTETLSPRAIAGIESQIAARADALIGRFKANGDCDFTRDYAAQLPVQVFLTMCGLPLADGPMLKHWADQFTRPDGSMTIAEATQKFRDYLDGPIRERRAVPRDDFLSRIVNGKYEDRALSHEECHALAAQVLLGGLDTVVNFLSFVMLFLARHRTHRRELIEHPALLPAAINEFLRRFPLATSSRVVERNVEFGGVQLHEGEMLVIPSALHGLDERANPDPLTVDFHRFNAQHSTFGQGPHHCPGSNLARTESRVTVERWLRAIPEFAVKPGADIAYRGGVVSAIDALPLVWNPIE
jgi:camphor 5-monooxygenase